MAGTRAPRRLALGLAAGAVATLALGVTSASAATNVSMFSSPTNGNFIFVVGEADADFIEVSVDGGTITLTDSGPGGITTPVGPCTAVNPGTVTCPTQSGGLPVVGLQAVLAAGGDSFVNRNYDIPLTVGPDDGNDLVRSGPGDDFIDDSLGEDVEYGEEGDDVLDGTSGNTNTGADLLDGGAGSDEIDYSGLVSSDGVGVTLADQQPNDGLPGEGDNAVSIERVIGTDRADSLAGDAGPNELIGAGGDDRLVGLAGNDELFGDEGDDLLNGGASPDGSPDLLACGLGTDIALGHPEDVVDGDCERTGARVAGESARARHGKAKVSIECPAAEIDPCAVTLSLFSNGRAISKPAPFTVLPGSTATVKAKLTRFGRRELGRSGGSLFVSAVVDTALAGGSAVNRAQILLYR